MIGFKKEGESLLWKYRGETLRVTPWGENGLRVTAACGALSDDNVVLEKPEAKSSVRIGENEAEVCCGKARCVVSAQGYLKFYSDGALALEELWAMPDNPVQFSMKRVPAREYRAVANGDFYQITQRFAACETEKLYGLGQRQCGYFELKGCSFELFQRNSEVNIPFLFSSRGYGLFWNDAGIGRVELSKNGTVWTAPQSRGIDYYIVCGSAKEIISGFTACVGRAPVLPDCGTGFWASKLRYRSQEELLRSAEKYCELGIRPSVMVVDYFHWKNNGDWKFDERFWPDPAKMVRTLKEMGIEVMVSVWPTVSPTSENYKFFKENGYLVCTNRGSRVQQTLLANLEFVDVTDEEARNALFGIIEKNYVEAGIRYFWLDAAEPEILPYDFDNIRYRMGGGVRVSNLYPYYFAKTFYDGLLGRGDSGVMNLVRSAFAGSQKFGAAVWSGDVMSSFASLRDQIFCGINMGLCGIPWWTNDIGGFEGADNKSERFRELLVRWFQFGAFCPIFRLHGSRNGDENMDGTDIGYEELIDVWGENHRKAKVNEYRENEPWIYSEKEFKIFRKYIRLREKLRPYIARQMRIAHETGLPVMRPLFLEYESDAEAWNIDDEYLFGKEVLVAPVYEEGARARSVYLPAGEWVLLETGKTYCGGKRYAVDAPLDAIPVFFAAHSRVLTEVRSC